MTGRGRAQPRGATALARPMSVLAGVKLARRDNGLAEWRQAWPPARDSERMRIENNSGQEITSVDAWGVLGKPASDVHWREYRSAYELAHAWIEGDAHGRLRSLLATRLPGVEFQRGVAERKTYF